MNITELLRKDGCTDAKYGPMRIEIVICIDMKDNKVLDIVQRIHDVFTTLKIPFYFF